MVMSVHSSTYTCLHGPRKRLDKTPSPHGLFASGRRSLFWCNLHGASLRRPTAVQFAARGGHMAAGHVLTSGMLNSGPDPANVPIKCRTSYR